MVGLGVNATDKSDFLGQPPYDLLQATADLVNIASVSHNETLITDLIEARLRAVPWLEVHRLDNNLVA